MKSEDLVQGPRGRRFLLPFAKASASPDAAHLPLPEVVAWAVRLHHPEDGSSDFFIQRKSEIQA